ARQEVRRDAGSAVRDLDDDAIALSLGADGDLIAIRHLLPEGVRGVENEVYEDLREPAGVPEDLDVGAEIELDRSSRTDACLREAQRRLDRLVDIDQRWLLVVTSRQGSHVAYDVADA